MRATTSLPTYYSRINFHCRAISITGLRHASCVALASGAVMQNLMCEQITVDTEMVTANLACVAARFAKALDGRPIWLFLSLGVAPAAPWYLREGGQA